MKKIDSTKRYEQLTERMGNGDIDRRSFFSLLGAAGITAGLTGGAMTMMTTQARAAGTSLNFEASSTMLNPIDSWFGMAMLGSIWNARNVLPKREELCRTKSTPPTEPTLGTKQSPSPSTQMKS